MSQFHPGRGTGIGPLLIVGLAGFDARQAGELREKVAIATTGAVQWRAGLLAEADAWVVDGSALQELEGSQWHVAAASSGERALRFDPHALGRPIAVSQPLFDATLAWPWTFDRAVPASLLLTLAGFAQRLRARAMLLHLAGVLAHRHARLKRCRAYRVYGDGRLLAVVDVDGDAGVHPDATPAQFQQAVWEPCAGAAAQIPRTFARGRTRQLLWEYASRAQRELLPARYRSTALTLGVAPLMPQRLFNDAHLFVMREMKRAPRTFRQLCAGAPVPPGEISRALSSLYLVGAIRSAEDEGRPR